MKKFPHSRDVAWKGAPLIIVLGLVVLATGLNNAERAMATSPSTGCLAIATAQIAAPGSFYKVGDTLDPVYGTLCNPGDNFGFRLQVASVNPSNGQVTSVTIVPGIGYSNPPSNPIRFGGSASGTGFTANCTFNALP